jgi:hypothetical protein
LRKLEERYAAELTVVGVHSGKYHTERDTSRIRDASLRLGVEHPVVNDRQFRIWRSYAVNAWPTIVVVDPRGYVIGQHAGEFSADEIAPFLERAIATLDDAGALVRRMDAIALDQPTRAPGLLRYPGKIAVQGNRVAIADSGHHRVLIGTLSANGDRANIERVVGSSRGFGDGAGNAAQFSSPQGVLFVNDELFVADSENHAIRAIDLASGHVRTVAGTGAQFRTEADIRDGALSSPWDLTHAGGRLFIAMAGSHQLWSVSPRGGDARPHSGNRSEELVDGPHPDAVLAQPMGITSDASRLYFVDAETSAVRWADTDPGGMVGTIVGTGLFDFGDRDGAGDDALMQHQQGIARTEDGRLLVADSYNDALKWVDPATRQATTWVRGLHEPSGLAVTDRHVYVADTNAHRIAVVHRDDGRVDDLVLS